MSLFPWGAEVLISGMATISSDLKRLFLRGIQWDAQSNGQSLYDTLVIVAKAKVSEMRDGRIIQSSGMGGASVAFTFPNGMTPTQAAALASEMLDRYEDAVDALPSEPNDDQIFSAMMQRLRPMRGLIRPNFATMRI